jgi:hypothetical protein
MTARGRDKAGTVGLHCYKMDPVEGDLVIVFNRHTTSYEHARQELERQNQFASMWRGIYLCTINLYGRPVSTSDPAAERYSLYYLVFCDGSVKYFSNTVYDMELP